VILSKRGQTIALLIPVVLLGTALAVNPSGIAARLSHDDPSIPEPAAHTGRQVTILGSGDILVHPPTWEQAAGDAKASGQTGYLFDPIFSQIKGPVSAADLAICHMEIPIGYGPPKDFPAFYAPPELAATVKRTGYDGCSTDSNHTFDQGQKGVRTTVELMDKAGLKHTGSYTTQKASTVPLIYDVHGVKVAQLSFATFYNEQRGHHRPSDKPWMAKLLSDDPAGVPKAAKAARDAGADIVVLSVHWGEEGTDTPTPAQIAMAKQWTADPNIDLILGGHSHTVQPVDQINGKWVVYSMGNTLARHDFPVDDNRQGILARFTFDEQANGKWKASAASVVPIWMGLRPRIQIVNLAAQLARLPRLDARRDAYQAAWDRIAKQASAGDGPAHGLTVAGAATS
jgi:poly-gamma-glutamate synthesis protein (capsule biosynthesis protein)